MQGSIEYTGEANRLKKTPAKIGGVKLGGTKQESLVSILNTNQVYKSLY